MLVNYIAIHVIKACIAPLHAVAPLMDITFTPKNVTVGESVSVTCSATEGFPVPKDIRLISPHHVMIEVENGRPYVLHNVQLEDGGTLTCELDGVIYSTQPSKSALLNVYSKFINLTLDGLCSHIVIVSFNP